MVINSTKEALAYGKFLLKDLEVSSLEAEILLCEVLGCDRVWLKTHDHDLLEDEQLCLYKNFIQRRSKNIPLAYVLGYKDWAGMKLIVNDSVLIPRDETELMCRYVMDEVKGGDSGLNKRQGKFSVLDIGTGSGAIAIFLAKNLLEYFVNNKGCLIEVLGLDISPKALSVARKNYEVGVENYGMKEVVFNFEESDLLGALEEGSEWSIITANLPYVPDNMVMSAEVGKEPDLALFSGIDGLDHYRRLYCELNNKCIQFESLWIEFLPQQEKEIQKIFSGWNVNFYEDVGGDVFFACIKPCSSAFDGSTH